MLVSDKEFAEIKSLLINISKDLKDIKERLIEIEEKINFEGYEELTEEEKKEIDKRLKEETIGEKELFELLEE
jgi:cytoskeletal protein CcmA (bactofilin family)